MKLFYDRLTSPVANDELTSASKERLQSDMNEYELDGTRLVPRERASGKTETVDQEWRVQKLEPSDRAALTIEQVLSAARARLRRLSPDEAYEAMVKTVGTRPTATVISR